MTSHLGMLCLGNPTTKRHLI